jgi:hypothetical protein
MKMDAKYKIKLKLLLYNLQNAKLVHLCCDFSETLNLMATNILGFKVLFVEEFSMCT